MSEGDILFRVKLDQLEQKLTKKVTEDSTKVTDADIQAYYEKNTNRLRQPERPPRLRVVLTKNGPRPTGQEGARGRRLLEQVVKQYSIDEASSTGRPAFRPWRRAAGEGARRGLLQGREGRIEGPVKTRSAGTSSSREDHAVLPADARAAKDTIKKPAALRGAAESAR